MNNLRFQGSNWTYLSTVPCENLHDVSMVLSLAHIYYADVTALIEHTPKNIWEYTVSVEIPSDIIAGSKRTYVFYCVTYESAIDKLFSLETSIGCKWLQRKK